MAAEPLADTGTAAGDLAFGRFRLSPARRALGQDGAPARLGPRAMDVLLALAGRR
jgi:DNA-binding winged helix-turn-helix (wHTH) protein